MRGKKIKVALKNFLAQVSREADSKLEKKLIKEFITRLILNSNDIQIILSLVRNRNPKKAYWDYVFLP